MLKFFLGKQNSLLSATFIVMMMIFFSRVLGLVRYRLLAHFFGGQLNLLDNFIAASLVPEAIFDILIFGTISIAFIPVFSNYLTGKKEEEAWGLVTSLFISGTLIFISISTLIFLFAPQISLIVAPGQVLRDHGSQVITTNLIRIMLLSQIFFVPGIILAGVFQSFRYFFIPALSPVLYNLGVILGIIFLSDKVSIYAPAYGMIFGAILFLLIQLPLAQKIRVRWIWQGFLTHGVVRVLTLSLPRTFTLLVSRANDLVNVALASLISQGSIVVFNFAQTLQLAPVGIVGASMAQAILPTFSIIYAKRDLALFRQVFLSTFHQLLFIIFPLSVILAVLRIPIVRLVFGASNFPWEATVATGQVLILFSFSLFAQVLNLLFGRAFYAMHDTKTPFFVTAISLIINIFLSLFFVMVKGSPVQYLALSFSLSAILQGTLLFSFLARKLGGFNLIEILLPTAKIFFASGLMAIALYIPMKLLDQLVFDTTRTLPLILLTGIASSSGLLVYAFLAWILNIGQLSPVLSFVRRFGKITGIKPSEAEVINGGTKLNP